MVRLSLLTTIVAIGFAHGKTQRQKNRKLEPRDAGEYHTKGFEQLAELYSEKKPSSKTELILDVSQIAASFCAENDHLCVSNAYKYTLEQFHEKKNQKKITFPKSTDPKIKNALRKTEKLIMDKDLDIDSLVAELTNIEDKLTDMKAVNEQQRVGALASVSVAIESSKLWHSVYNDKEHSLHEMRGVFGDGRKRSLESVVHCDFEAAVNAAINVAFDDILVFSVWPEIILTVIPNSYAASVKCAFESEDEDEDE